MWLWCKLRRGRSCRLLWGQVQEACFTSTVAQTHVRIGNNVFECVADSIALLNAAQSCLGLCPDRCTFG